jgi:Tfp pilus assembly protein PilW
MQKIKAFTLLDLLVGMIISSLVIGFCFMSYFIIYKQYLNYRTTKQVISDVVLLNTVISSDFIRSNKITTGNENELILDNETKQVINYHFTPEFIIRQTGETVDTFKINSSNCIPVYVTDMENEKLSLLTGFSFDSNVLGEQEHFNFTKYYGADVIINESIPK